MVNSRRIDAFKKRTLPYTGQVKSTNREEYTPEKLFEETSKVFTYNSNLPKYPLENQYILEYI